MTTIFLHPTCAPVTEEDLRGLLATQQEVTVWVAPEGTTQAQVEQAFEIAGGCSVDTAHFLGAIVVDFESNPARLSGRACITDGDGNLLSQLHAEENWQWDSYVSQLLEALDTARQLVEQT